jgi:F0F1-type ATP synthase epsilon subunit
MLLKIVSTEWVLFEDEVEEVIVPTLDWEAGILPWHALYTAVLKWW